MQKFYGVSARVVVVRRGQKHARRDAVDQQVARCEDRRQAPKARLAAVRPAVQKGANKSIVICESERKIQKSGSTVTVTVSRHLHSVARQSDDCIEKWERVDDESQLLQTENEFSSLEVKQTCT